jgi:transposase
MNLHNFYEARVAPSGLFPLLGWYTFELPKLVHFSIAINIKEDLYRLWRQNSKAEATAFLDSWIARAEQSEVSMLKRFAKTLDGNRDGILAFYDFPISTGPLEGTNNKIKTLQKQAYGFRDLDFFKLKIYGLHETKFALVG